jgi:multidrug efflux pump subunit AcrB
MLAMGPLGRIAFAGKIVRDSILLADFALEEVRKGVDVREAVLLSCKARTRPIIITALVLRGASR